MKLTPRQVKIALREGRMEFAPGYPRLPKDWSKFQRRRLAKAFRVTELYLRRGYSVTRCQKKLACRHQRVCQILDFAIRHLVETGHIHPVPEPVNKVAA